MNRSAAARWTARPPSTEPVKHTWSMRGSATTFATTPWSATSDWSRPSGRVPRAASARRSATSGVWSECFRTTALPASRAGTRALTAVR